MSEKAELRLITTEAIEKLQEHPWFKPIIKKINKHTGSTIAETLKEIPFLSHMSMQKLKILGELFSFCTFKAKDCICKQGDDGDAFFIILSGKAKVEACTDGTHMTFIAQLEPGAFFGEIALLQKIPRKASVTCTEESTCLKLATRDFENFLMCAPSMKKGLDSMAGLRSAEVLKSVKVPFFEGLTTDKLNYLAETCRVRQFESGTEIIKQGDVGEAFFVIMFGDCVVNVCESVDETGKPLGGEAVKEVGTLHTSQYFGELALISDERRLATIKCVTKVVCLEFGKDAFNSIFFSSPESVADFAIRLQQENTQLTHVLNHSFANERFRKYLEGEYCQESINFWIAAHQYTKTPTAQRHEMAEDIYHLYISQKGKQQVNIPATMRVKIEKGMNEEGLGPRIDLFTEAREEIYKLMERDNFRRFKKSKYFQEVLDAVHPYTKTKSLLKSASSAKLNAKVMEESSKERKRISTLSENDISGIGIRSGSSADGDNLLDEKDEEVTTDLGI